MTALMIDYGYFGLFLSAFLAATILPLSSEAVMAAMILSGEFALIPLWCCATAGNSAGSMVNWGLGRWVLKFQTHRWFPFSAASIDAARRRFLRFGIWSLLFAWLPIIGDPITFVAGMFRVPIILFTVLVLVGKGGRYAFLIYVTSL